MGCTKTILCLANSRKPPSGRCIAGREMVDNGFGAWIRPVSARETKEVSEEERQYQDGTDPAVLDVIRITMIRPDPALHQKENILIDDRYYWQKQGVVPWSALQEALEDPGAELWMNGYSSTRGYNDRIPEQCLSKIIRSLYLVRPADLRLIVASESTRPGMKRRVRAQFTLNRKRYKLVVTDPRVEREYFARDDQEHLIRNALLCVSLSEVFYGFSYKLVASVITPSI